MVAQYEAFSADETGIPQDELKSFVTRIENLEEQKSALSEDVKSVFAELKSRGYDQKAVRSILRLRKLDPNERTEQEAIVETYMTALGML